MTEANETRLWIVSPMVGAATFFVVFYLTSLLIHTSGAVNALDIHNPDFSLGVANYLSIIRYALPSTFGFWAFFTLSPVVSQKIGGAVLLAFAVFTLFLAAIWIMGCGGIKGWVSSFCWGYFISMNYWLIGITAGTGVAYLLLTPKEKDKYREADLV